MTRGRRRDPTLEPTRQLQTSRAFRERRAAHLKALEEQVKTQSEEIKGLKARLGEPEEDEEGEGEDGDEQEDEEEQEAEGHEGASGNSAAAVAVLADHWGEQTISGHRQGTLSFSTTASSSRSSLEQMSPERGAKRRLTEGSFYGTGDRRRPATSSGHSGSSTPHQPPASCSNCEVVRQQAHQLLVMLGDLEQRMGTMRAAGVMLGQTLHQQQQQHQHQQHPQLQPHQSGVPSPSRQPKQQVPSMPPPYSSSSTTTSPITSSISGGGAPAHASTNHRALFSVPVAAAPSPSQFDLPRLSLPSLPTVSLPTATGAATSGGGGGDGGGCGGSSRLPPTPAEEKCCLGIFSCDENGRIVV